MSRKPSKFRKRKREQRERAKPITVDIETRSAADIGTRVHQNIERLISGHYHVEHKGINPQLMAYAHAAGIDHVALYVGGDIVHEPVLHGDLVPYDLAKAEKAMKDYDEVIRRAMSMKQPYKPDPRLDPFTGRIMPVFGEDDNG